MFATLTLPVTLAVPCMATGTGFAVVLVITTSLSVIAFVEGAALNRSEPPDSPSAQNTIK
jgi:hypothetical protein